MAERPGGDPYNVSLLGAFKVDARELSRTLKKLSFAEGVPDDVDPTYRAAIAIANREMDRLLEPARADVLLVARVVDVHRPRFEAGELSGEELDGYAQEIIAGLDAHDAVRALRMYGRKIRENSPATAQCLDFLAYIGEVVPFTIGDHEGAISGLAADIVEELMEADSEGLHVYDLWKKVFGTSSPTDVQKDQFSQARDELRGIKGDFGRRLFDWKAGGSNTVYFIDPEVPIEISFERPPWPFGDEAFK